MNGIEALHVISIYVDSKFRALSILCTSRYRTCVWVAAQQRESIVHRILVTVEDLVPGEKYGCR